MTIKEKRDIKRKLNVINYAKKIGNVNKACRHYGVSKTIFYQWIKRYNKEGEQGLINQKPCPENIKLRTPIEVEEKVIYLRKIPLWSGTDLSVFKAVSQHSNI